MEEKTGWLNSSMESPERKSIMALLYITAQVRCSYLEGLITDSLKLSRWTEKVETMLIWRFGFSVNLSGLLDSCWARDLVFSNLQGVKRADFENSLFLLKAKIHLLKICRQDYPKNQTRINVWYVSLSNLNTGIKVYTGWVRKIQPKFPNS